MELPAVDTTNMGDPELTYMVVSTGTYYLGVSSSGDVTYDPTVSGDHASGSSTGLYALSVTDLLARFVNATPLSGSGNVPGKLTGGQPEDYSVNVTSDMYLLATAAADSSPGFEPRLTLYNGTSQLLIQSDQHDPGLASATVEQHLQAGTYYVEVSAALSTSVAASTQAYQLTTTLDPSLPSSSPLPLGASGPAGMVLADLLGNGHLDIVAANYGSNSVSVLLGNGDGTFSPDPFSSPELPLGTFAVGAGPYALAVADLGNGHLDIVTANYYDNTVSVLLGNGDGTFQQAQSFTVGFAPEAVAVADLGNSRADIVTGNEDDTVSVLLGNGDGTFQPAQTFAVGNQPMRSGGGGPGQWPRRHRHRQLRATARCRCCSGQRRRFTLQPPSPSTVGSGSGPIELAVADLGNGRPDIVTANVGDNMVSVLLGSGAVGSFTHAGTYEVGSEPDWVTVADLGNGHADIVTANFGDNTVSVLLGNGDGSTFSVDRYSSPGSPPGTFAVGDGPSVVAVADLGNGHDDIVTANSRDSTVSVRLGNGDGFFAAGQYSLPALTPGPLPWGLIRMRWRWRTWAMARPTSSPPTISPTRSRCFWEMAPAPSPQILLRRRAYPLAPSRWAAGRTE